MPDQHARLGPSSAARWIHCPISVQLIEAAAPAEPQPESPAAAEGTHAHELAELRAGRYFGLLGEDEFSYRYFDWQRRGDESDWDIQEMERNISEYIRVIADAVDSEQDAVILLEQRLDTGIKDCWGTGDCVIVSPDAVHIIDLKYGKGVPVSATGNPQLRLYGLGALRTFGDILGTPKTVRMTIFQPRNGGESTDEMTVEDLEAWAKYVVEPAAAETRSPLARFGPGEAQCRFCPISGQCPAQMEASLRADFGGEPKRLSNSEIGEALTVSPVMRQWLDAVADVALDRAYSQGQKIPGFKVVRRGGRRQITDEAAALEKLSEIGYTVDETTTVKIKTLGALEKMIGAKQLSEVLGDLLHRNEGKPAIVPESAKGMEISPMSDAKNDFKGAV